MFQAKPLMKGFQGRNSRQETGDGSVAEAMGEYSLLAYLPWFLSLLSYCIQEHMPMVAPNKMDSLTSNNNKENAQESYGIIF